MRYLRRLCSSLGRQLEDLILLADCSISVRHGLLPRHDDFWSVQAVEEQELTAVGTIEQPAIWQLSRCAWRRSPVSVIKEFRLDLAAPDLPTLLSRDPARRISIVSVDADLNVPLSQKVHDLFSAEIVSNQLPLLASLIKEAIVGHSVFWSL